MKYFQGQHMHTKMNYDFRKQNLTVNDQEKGKTNA